MTEILSLFVIENEISQLTYIKGNATIVIEGDKEQLLNSWNELKEVVDKQLGES